MLHNHYIRTFRPARHIVWLEWICNISFYENDEFLWIHNQFCFPSSQRQIKPNIRRNEKKPGSDNVELQRKASCHRTWSEPENNTRSSIRQFLKPFKETVYHKGRILIIILKTFPKFLKAIGSTQISNSDKSPLIS